MLRRFWKKSCLISLPVNWINELNKFSEYLNQKSRLESKPLLKIERVPLEESEIQEGKRTRVIDLAVEANVKHLSLSTKTARVALTPIHHSYYSPIWNPAV